jgi:hypothetical protein
MSSRKLSTLRACGADDGTATRTPLAWMILLNLFLALRQIVFFVWVTFGEQKWVTFAERRGAATPSAQRESPPTSKMAAQLKTPRQSPRMNRRVQRSSTTALATKSRLMRLSGLQSESDGAPIQRR